MVSCRPPNGVITMVSTLSTKTHKTLHHAETDESMVSVPSRPYSYFQLTVAQIPVFERDTDGSPPKSKYIMGKRNWCSVRWDPPSGELIWDIRVEITKGNGTTTGYVVRLVCIWHRL